MKEDQQERKGEEYTMEKSRKIKRKRYKFMQKEQGMHLPIANKIAIFISKAILKSIE